MIPKSNELSPERLERYACNDCEVNVAAVGEFYMLDPKIWSGRLGLGWDDNLCIGCLERRLGRKISARDMSSFPSYDWMAPASERLMDRLGFKRNSNGKWLRKRMPRTGLTRKSKMKAAALYHFQSELIEGQEARERAWECAA
jgi:hypothetical protein